MAANNDPAMYALLFAEAQRGIKEQATVLDGLRTKATTLFSAAALANSFLGGTIAFGDKVLSEWGWYAAGAFIGVGVLALYVMWPRTFTFVPSPAVLLEHYVEADPPLTISETHRYLAQHLEEDYDSNQRTMDGMWWAYRGQIILTVAAIILWFVELART